MRKIIFLLLMFFSVINFSNAYETQWFVSYSENDGKIDFKCEKQCFIILWNKQKNDYIDLNSNLVWDWTIWYWFLNWNNIIPWEFLKIETWRNINKNFMFNKLAYYSQLNSILPVILIMEWNLKSDNLIISLSKTTFLDSIIWWFKQSLEFKSFNPRTINFLEWPMRNWRYINEVFFLFMVLVLISLFLLYKFIDNKNKYIYIWLWFIMFFWFFFDFFHSINQVKIFRDFKSSDKVMDNWRLAKNSDLYDFLDFVKENIPKREKGFIIAPYPYKLELKFHIYPDLKFDDINKVKYLIWYNPDGKNVFFGFKDPVYNTWSLTRGENKFDIYKEIIWKDYAKIFVIKQ